MSNNWLPRIIAASIGVAMAVATPVSASAETVLRYSSWLPTNHWLNTQAMQPYMAEVEAATGGAVKIEQLPKSVGAPPAQFDVCRDGLADICVVVVGYTPGRFALAEVGELPFMGDDPKTMSPKFDTYYRENFLKYDEFKGVYPLAFIKTSSGNLYTRADKPAKTLADVSGLKLRTAGRVTSAELELMGAIPILKSSTEAYELLSTGVIDGSMMLTESVLSTNSIGLLKNGLIVPGGMFSSTLVVVINQRVWDGLSEEDRSKVMEKSGASLSARFGNAYDAADEASRAAMAEAGYDLTVADKDSLEEIRTVLKPVDDSWIARATEVGLPDAAATLDQLRSILSE